MVVAAAFVVVVLTTDDRGGGGYLRAGLEAAMVGGLADWFAVVAIFRRPLGLPIPHTAVIVARKDAFGETLGSSCRSTSSTPRRSGNGSVRSAWPIGRRHGWSFPTTPTRPPGTAPQLVVRLADVVKDDDLVHLAETEVRNRLSRVDVAPLAGRLLGLVTEEGRHRELVDAVLVGVDGFLAENEMLLRARFGEESPWWIPEVIDDRIFARLLSGVPPSSGVTPWVHPTSCVSASTRSWPGSSTGSSTTTSGGVGRAAQGRALDHPSLRGSSIRCGPISRRRCGRRPRPTSRRCGGVWRR